MDSQDIRDDSPSAAGSPAQRRGRKRRLSATASTGPPATRRSLRDGHSPGTAEPTSTEHTARAESTHRVSPPPPLLSPPSLPPPPPPPASVLPIPYVVPLKATLFPNADRLPYTSQKYTRGPNGLVFNGMSSLGPSFQFPPGVVSVVPPSAAPQLPAAPNQPVALEPLSEDTEEETGRRCPRCKLLKPESAFKGPRRGGGRHVVCLPCREKRRLYVKQRRDKAEKKATAGDELPKPKRGPGRPRKNPKVLTSDSEAAFTPATTTAVPPAGTSASTTAQATIVSQRGLHTSAHPIAPRPPSIPLAMHSSEPTTSTAPTNLPFPQPRILPEPSTGQSLEAEGSPFSSASLPDSSLQPPSPMDPLDFTTALLSRAPLKPPNIMPWSAGVPINWLPDPGIIPEDSLGPAPNTASPWTASIDRGLRQVANSGPTGGEISRSSSAPADASCKDPKKDQEDNSVEAEDPGVEDPDATISEMHSPVGTDTADTEYVDMADSEVQNQEGVGTKDDKSFVHEGDRGANPRLPEVEVETEAAITGQNLDLSPQRNQKVVDSSLTVQDPNRTATTKDTGSLANDRPNSDDVSSVLVFLPHHVLIVIQSDSEGAIGRDLCKKCEEDGTDDDSMWILCDHCSIWHHAASNCMEPNEAHWSKNGNFCCRACAPSSQDLQKLTICKSRLTTPLPAKKSDGVRAFGTVDYNAFGCPPPSGGNSAALELALRLGREAGSEACSPILIKPTPEPEPVSVPESELEAKQPETGPGPETEPEPGIALVGLVEPAAETETETETTPAPAPVESTPFPHAAAAEEPQRGEEEKDSKSVSAAIPTPIPTAAADPVPKTITPSSVTTDTTSITTSTAADVASIVTETTSTAFSPTATSTAATTATTTDFDEGNDNSNGEDDSDRSSDVNGSGNGDSNVTDHAAWKAATQNLIKDAAQWWFVHLHR